MHLTTSPLDWYAARAAGVAATLVIWPAQRRSLGRNSESFGFEARCRAGDGTHRVVHASSGLSGGKDFTVRVVVHA